MIRLFFFIFLGQLLFSQVFWLASSELGYYNSSGNYLQFTDELLTRLNLKAGYKFNDNKNVGNIDLQLHPEIYGLENKLQTTKIAIDGFYTYFGSEVNWTFRISANQYYFTGYNIDFSYDSFLLNTELLWPFETQLTLNAKMGFAYRNFNERDAATLDIFFSEIAFVYAYNSYLKSGVGLHLEKFELKNKYNYFINSEKSSNRGTRIGPAIRFNYTRNFILSADYQFLIHDSDITVYPSFDQWLRLICGKSIIKNWTVFILLDYYKRNFEYHAENNVTDLLYSPVNVENRIYFKLSNTIKNNQKIYLKVGYFDEKLFYRDYSLSGWKSLIGYEIKG